MRTKRVIDKMMKALPILLNTRAHKVLRSQTMTNSPKRTNPHQLRQMKNQVMDKMVKIMKRSQISLLRRSVAHHLLITTTMRKKIKNLKKEALIKKKRAKKMRTRLSPDMTQFKKY